MPQTPLEVFAGLRTLHECAQKLVTQALGLSEVALPEDIRWKEGALRGEPLFLRTQRFLGDGVEAATLSETFLEGRRLVSVTLSVYPEATSPAPILGIDLVAINGPLHLVVMDLSPTDRAFWEAHGEQRLIEAAAMLGLLKARKRPDFIDASFSPQAIFAAAKPGAEEPAFRAARHLMETYPAMLRAGREHQLSQDDQRTARLNALKWRLAMQKNKKESKALERLFGGDIIPYLDDFLFGLPPDAKDYGIGE